jgi:hypothetical protein
MEKAKPVTALTPPAIAKPASRYLSPINDLINDILHFSLSKIIELLRRKMEKLAKLSLDSGSNRFAVISRES